VIYQEIIINIVAFIIAYLIGSLNWSIIVSLKTQKGDIRKIGSGNAGATNMARNFSMIHGLIIFFLDALKVTIVGLITWILIKWGSWHYFSYLIVQIACLGAFFGHLYPIYYRFKGGKGVSSYYGFLLIYNIIFFVVSYLSSYLIYKKWKYVSLGSITIPTVIFLLSWIPWMNSGPLTYFVTPMPFWFNPLCLFIIDIIIVVKHIPNIKRLIAKTEKGIK
jgi:glycerol-3-phosphate acyltransferase PlsY